MSIGSSSACIAFLGLALLASGSLAAAAGVNLGGHDSGAPVAVSAKNFTGDFETKIGTYSGDVIVSQGNFKLHADTVRIAVAKGKASTIIATGHVLFDAPSGTASGGKAVYDMGERAITLTGNVVLTKGKNVMRGTRLTVNLDSGQATMAAQGMPGGRVQGLFTLPPKHKTPKDNGKN